MPRMTTAVAGIQHSFPPHIHRVFEDNRRPYIHIVSLDLLKSCCRDIRRKSGFNLVLKGAGGAGVLKEA